MAVRKRSRADIALTLGINPEFDARRLADEMTRGFKQAGVEAGIDYNDSFTREVDKMPPKVARAMRRTAAAFGQVEEAADKVSNRLAENTRNLDAVNAAQERYNRIAADALSTDEDRARALADLTAEQDRYNQSTRALITERAKFNRANQNTANSLGLVDAALDSIADNDGAGQTLLTVGKYISAIRAAAIPIFGAVAAVGGSAIISSAAALSQALWMIPSGAAAVTAGIGSMKIATLGFSDAVENMADPEKFYEALQNLSPNAQQAALSIQALTEPLKQLKNATQDALFADFAPMINDMARQYLPMIEQLTSGIAGAFNNAAKSIFDQLMTPETQSVLQDTFNNLVLAFERLAPAAGPFVDAISRIVQTGSSFLPRIADSITGMAEDFAAFITEAQKSGDLERWFREGLEAAEVFWEIIKEVGKAFANLAPAGREVLPEIKTMITSLTQTLPSLVENLNKVVAPFAAIMDAAARMYNFVAEKIDQLRQKVQEFAQRLGPLGRLLMPADQVFSQAPFGGGGPFGGTATGATSGLIVPKSGMGAGSYAQAKGGSGAGSYAQGKNPFNIAPVPTGGYPLPPPPPEKGSATKEKKADEPPFAADPSLYSLDAVPIGSFLDGAPTPAMTTVPQAPPLAAEAPAIAPVETLPAGMAPQGGLVPNAVNLNNIISSLFPGMSSVGGWRGVDYTPYGTFAEHASGEALDFMVGQNMALGDAINSVMLDNAKALGLQYTLWRQSQFFPDGRVVPMPDRGGDPTQNHMDHIHARVFPGDAVAGGVVTGLAGPMEQGAVPGMPGGPSGYMAVDNDAIANAENDRLGAREAVEEARFRLLELQAKGDATQLQLLTARNNVQQAERRYLEAEDKLAKARLGTYKKFDTDFSKAAEDTTNSLSGAASGLSDIGAALANDFGISEGLPGIAKWLTTFLANLAFAPMLGALSAVSAVGNARSGTSGASGLIGMFAPPTGPMDPSAIGPNPLGGGVGAPLPGQAQNMQAAQYPLMKFDDGGMLPPGGMGINLTNKPEPVLTGEQWAQIQTSMQSATPVPHGTSGGATPGPQAGESTSRAPAAVGGGGFTGLGGMPMQAINTAISAAGFGLDAFAPGAGQAASAAAQIGIQLANRAAGYAGQVAGIAVGGLMETFLPNNSAVADPAKSWIGKIASGISGARPAVPNQANSSAPAKPPAMPQQATQTGAGGPVVLIENMVNQTPDGGQTIANQMARQAQTGYLSRMGAR